MILKDRLKKFIQPDWRVCRSCGRRASEKVWKEHLNVCPYCGKYYPLTAKERFRLIFDPGTEEEFGQEVLASDPLHFPGYEEKLEEKQKQTDLQDSAVTAKGKIGGISVIAIVMDTRFFMGSMSTAVGERITRAVEEADRTHVPLIIFCASGGARMQEGIYSLMQMAKTAAAIEKFSEDGGLYISCLTHPTTGGVTASFATLGDITLAEPGALIGFAGPRVIEQTIGQKLPKGFQRSEYLMKHGFVDKIVERKDLKNVLVDILKLHESPAAEKEDRPFTPMMEQTAAGNEHQTKKIAHNGEHRPQRVAASVRVKKTTEKPAVIWQSISKRTQAGSWQNTLKKKIDDGLKNLQKRTDTSGWKNLQKKKDPDSNEHEETHQEKKIGFLPEKEERHVS